MSEQPSAARPRRSWLARSAMALGAAVVLVATYIGLQVAPLLLEPDAYTQVVSIERESAYRDEALMSEASRLPVAASFDKSPYEFQHNQSFCGPTSVADVLHSLGDPLTQDRVLDNSPYHTFFGYLLGGLTLDQEKELLAKLSGRPVTIFRDITLDEFREHMRALNDPKRRYVANFHRGPLFGRGHGHFSPLLAYLPEPDLVLVGDVNAAYRPFLVSTERLWRATDTIDGATGKKRGLAMVSVE